MVLRLWKPTDSKTFSKRNNWVNLLQYCCSVAILPMWHLAITHLKEMICRKYFILNIVYRRNVFELIGRAKMKLEKCWKVNSFTISKFFEAMKFHSSLIIHLVYIIQVSDIIVILVIIHVLSKFYSSDNLIYNSVGKKR